MSMGTLDLQGRSLSGDGGAHQGYANKVGGGRARRKKGRGGGNTGSGRTGDCHANWDVRQAPETLTILTEDTCSCSQPSLRLEIPLNALVQRLATWCPASDAAVLKNATPASSCSPQVRSTIVPKGLPAENGLPEHRLPIRSVLGLS
jgi:hypothetical protein